jgi:hypothetical protein
LLPFGLVLKGLYDPACEINLFTKSTGGQVSTIKKASKMHGQVFSLRILRIGLILLAEFGGKRENAISPVPDAPGFLFLKRKWIFFDFCQRRTKRWE